MSTTALPAPRRVRVFFEGNAVHRDIARGLVVQVDGGGTVFVPDDITGVEVEDINPPAPWTDGDVVQEVDTDKVWRRVPSTITPGASLWTGGVFVTRSDADIDQRVATGRARVLRQQAAGQ